MPPTSQPWNLLALAALALMLSACGMRAQPTGAPLADAEIALETRAYSEAIELATPWLGTNADAERLIAHARLGLAEQLSADAQEPERLRDAFDQIALALPLASADSALDQELRTASSSLIALLEQADQHRAEANQPIVEVVAATPAPAPPPLPAPKPRPRPRPPVSPGSFAISKRQSFEGSGNSAAFASCVDIQVLSTAGPVSGAVIGINNGEHSYQNQTDSNGYTGRCGLGASHWSVVLFWTPGEGTVQGATTTVYVNGAPEQRAAVVFQRR